MLDPETVLTEHEQDFEDRPARIQRLREELREYAGVDVPRSAAAVPEWYDAKKGVITKRLNAAVDGADDED